MNQPQHKSKSRTAVWLYPETIKKMDSMLDTDNAKSRSEFIEKALQFYMGYLTNGNMVECLVRFLWLSYMPINCINTFFFSSE